MRALRRRKGWRQEDLAAAAKVSQAAVSRAERGHVAGLSLAATRSLFAALDAGCSVSVWWRSGELDRLLDEDHAALVARAVAFLERHGWSAQVEATFQVDRESGSIDILATRRADGVALVVEVKSRLMSVEELLRTLDRKVRVAAQVVLQRDGWRPTFVGRLVVFADDSTNRRRVARASVLETALPLRGHEIAAWLRAPGGAAAGLVFLLSQSTGGS